MGRVFPTTKNNNYQLIILILSQGVMLGRVFIYSCHLGCFSLNPDVPLFFCSIYGRYDTGEQLV